MKVQIQKWGNSLALRIPKSFAIQTNVGQGSTVDISLEAGSLVIKPVAQLPEYELHDLLSRVTKRNAHSEIETGGPVGNEVW